MAMLQAYQAELLRDLDEGGEVGSKAVQELCRVTDLSLQATKASMTIHGSYGGYGEAPVVEAVQDGG